MLSGQRRIRAEGLLSCSLIKTVLAYSTRMNEIITQNVNEYTVR